jgi:alpha-beta hydrolase superfamily lysophospholipase
MRVVAVAVAAMAATLPIAAFELPAPTGRFPVGTTSWHVTDAARRETFSASGEPRQVEVLAWYPAAANRGGKPAPYLRSGLAEVRSFATLFGVSPDSFDDLAGVRTHAILDAPPATGSRKLPVLLFSHGYTGIPSAYTALLEDLASHGYAVLSVVHPYEASGATLADGRVVTLLDPAGKLRSGVSDVFGEWGPEDQTMAAVTSTADPAEKLRLLRGYLAGLNKTHAALGRWVDDTRVVLDRLSSLPATSAAGRLAARLDVRRVGVFGHSMGGVTAGQFCVDDARCAAGLNLDGIPQSGTMIDKPMPRPFLMVYSARPGRLGASDSIYQRAARPYYRVDVADTRHLDFSDMALWGGPLRQRPVLGPIDPVRASAITAEIVRQYFDQELLGRRSTLLAGTSSFPEVKVISVKPLPATARQ